MVKKKPSTSEPPKDETPWARAKREKKPYIDIRVDTRTTDAEKGSNIRFWGPATLDEANMLREIIACMVRGELRKPSSGPGPVAQIRALLETFGPRT